jgi:2-polyprenyl-3-methyl-5-hydroxy-6-metoxy-1,4-benzoquinol methylase
MAGAAGSGPDLQLVSWLRSFTASPVRRRCLVVGCGAGDDAEALASAGFEVTAFDADPAAVAEARRRFSRSGVAYEVAAVLSPPAEWAGRFDLVFDGGTLEAAAAAQRDAIRAALNGFLASGGRLFVLCATRDALDGFEALGLRAALIEEPIAGTSARRFRAFFDRLEA